MNTIRALPRWSGLLLLNSMNLNEVLGLQCIQRCNKMPKYILGVQQARVSLQSFLFFHEHGEFFHSSGVSRLSCAAHMGVSQKEEDAVWRSHKKMSTTLRRHPKSDTGYAVVF